MQPRLLAVDNMLIVPVNATVRVEVTGADVIHAFAVPAFGVIIDAVPGRLNETWFNARKEGVYYGECRELCGKDHAFMPIAVRVVPQAVYDAWVAALQAGSVADANKTLPPLTAADVTPTERRWSLDQGNRRKWPIVTRCKPTMFPPTRRMSTTATSPAGAATSIRRTIRTSARCT